MPSRIVLAAFIACFALRAEAQQAPAFDPEAVQHPGRLCSVLAPMGLGASGGWEASRSTPGGYVCRPLGTATPVGGGQAPTMLNAYVYGGGARKLDRFTLKLNIFNRATSDEGKRELIRAAHLVAAEMGIQLPQEVVRAVQSQAPTFLNSPPSSATRNLFRRQVGGVIIQVQADQSRVTAILIHFRNPRESDLW